MDKLREICSSKKKDSTNTTTPSRKNPCCADTKTPKPPPIPAGGPPLQITDLRRGSCEVKYHQPQAGCHPHSHKDGTTTQVCHKHAYITLATNDTYALGCLVVGASLRHVGTKHEVIVMITRHVSDNMRSCLAHFFDHIVQYDILDSHDTANLALIERPELGVTLTKLHCWTLTAYHKAVYLDADTLIVRNCDELFDEYEDFSAAPDVGWPDLFNSGVFVFAPSMATYDKLLNFTRANRSFDGGDQGILNMFFNNWARDDIKKHLPFIYNMVASIVYSYRPAFKYFCQNVKIVHFLGATKPWHSKCYDTSCLDELPADSGDLVKLWWKMFMENVIPCISADLVGEADVIVKRCKQKLQMPSQEDHLEDDMDVHYAEVHGPATEQ